MMMAAKLTHSKPWLVLNLIHCMLVWPVY